MDTPSEQGEHLFVSFNLNLTSRRLGRRPCATIGPERSENRSSLACTQDSEV